MATIGPIKLKITVAGAEATVDVTSDITFDAKDRRSLVTGASESPSTTL